MNSQQKAVLTTEEFDHCIDILMQGSRASLTEAARATWYEVLQDTEGPVLMAAVHRMIGSDEYAPKVARLKAIASDIARERLNAVTQPAPPAGLDSAEYMRWNKAWRQGIIRGDVPEVAQAAAIEAVRSPGALEAGRDSQQVVVLPPKPQMPW